MKRTRLSRALLSAWLLWAATGLAWAQTAKEQPPEGGTPHDFTLPAAQTYTLDNQLTVTTIPYGAVPKATVQMVVRAGNLAEGTNQLWLADLLGDFLKEGTAHSSGEQLARKAAGLGGELSVNVGADQTSIGISVLSEHTADAVVLLGEVLTSSTFPESELERLKKNLARTVSIQRSQPQSLALERFRKLLYGDQRYASLFPTDEMLAAYSVADVKDFFQSHFGPAASTLYIAGVFDQEEVRSSVSAAFGSWQASVQPAEAVQPGSVHRGTFLVDRPGAAQSSLIVGLPVVDPSDPDYLPLSVANALLGGSFGSRITSNIREDKGYTYSPHSAVASRFRDAYWAENADVSTNVTGASIKEILYEIRRLAEEPPSAQELKSIQNYLAGIFVLQNSSRSGIIGITAFVRLHGLDASYLSTYVERVHAVTPAQVSEMVRKYIRPDDLSIVVVGDKSQVTDQLRPYGPIEP